MLATDQSESLTGSGKASLTKAGESVAVEACLDRFVSWLGSFGETSFDHQSFFAGIGGHAKSLYYRNKWLGIPAVAPMILAEAVVPAARQLFWHKQRFPIADAHYAMGFAMRARMHGRPDDHERAVRFLRVLLESRSRQCRFHGWGYPFDWVTRNGIMKADTPLITTTPYVYEAFEAVHDIDNNGEWLSVMHSIAEHALREIPDLELSPGVSSAAYNPIDTVFRVVNASAYRAFLLFSAARRFDRQEYADAAGRNLAFVIGAQNPDGSWPYAVDGVRDFVDHFHTCFVLKALAKIERLGVAAGCSDAIRRGTDYYVENLFDSGGCPAPFSNAPRLTVYRHELYDYAECLNIATLLRGRFPALDKRLDSTLQDLLARWIKQDGSFRSRELILGWDNVPMHRWAQSQVFRSLSQLALASA